MDERPTHLDLFSGIGGFAKAAREAGFRTIGFCEIDGYCQQVLAKNFLAYATSSQDNEQRRDSEQWRSAVGWNGQTPQRDDRQADHDSLNGCRPCIHSNIFDLNGRDFAGVSLVTGGFPCQPFSVAGKRGGAADDRAIWPEMFRVISEARPAWVLGENVPGIIPMELDNVLSDLEGIGYATRAFVIPACAVDARHRRDRVWIVARDVARRSTGEIRSGIPDTNQQGSQGRNGQELRECASERTIGSGDSPMADAGSFSGNGRSSGSCRWEREPLEALRDAGRGRRQEDGMSIPESLLGRVAHGIPKRVDRLKGLGNAIVPQVAYEILREIRKLIC